MTRRFEVVVGALATCAALASCSPAPVESAAPDGDWVSLFNGRDLDDWTPKFTGFPLGENLLDTFQVRDGVLVVSYDNHQSWDDRYGHLFYAARPFSHYWLRVEYRFVGDQVSGAPDWAWRNNGVMLHAQPPETMLLDQEFPASIEVRLLGGGRAFGPARPTADLCVLEATVLLNGERTTVRCHDSSSPTMRGDQWVLVEAEVQDGEVVRHYVNGERVMEYTDIRLDEPKPWSPTLALTSGYIAIQAESHPTEFRRIEILDLGD